MKRSCPKVHPCTGCAKEGALSAKAGLCTYEKMDKHFVTGVCVEYAPVIKEEKDGE